MTDDSLSRIEALIRPTLAQCGVELFDVHWSSGGRNGLLRLLIDKPGGVSLADCERVSSAVGAVLDVHDAIPAAYTLEVSSPGAERPVRTPDEWRAAIARRVNVRARAGTGEVVVEGLVVAVGPDSIELESRYGTRVRRSRVELADVLAARIVVDV